MNERRLIGGHFYPLDVALALGFASGVGYVAECVAQALREPRSERNVRAQRAVRVAPPSLRALRARAP